MQRPQLHDQNILKYVYMKLLNMANKKWPDFITSLKLIKCNLYN